MMIDHEIFECRFFPSIRYFRLGWFPTYCHALKLFRLRSELLFSIERVILGKCNVLVPSSNNLNISDIGKPILGKYLNDDMFLKVKLKRTINLFCRKTYIPMHDMKLVGKFDLTCLLYNRKIFWD